MTVILMLYRLHFYISDQKMTRSYIRYNKLSVMVLEKMEVVVAVPPISDEHTG